MFYKWIWWRYKEDVKKCVPVNDEEIEGMEEAAKDSDEISNFKIECSSNYISNALLILLSLLF